MVQCGKLSALYRLLHSATVQFISSSLRTVGTYLLCLTTQTSEKTSPAHCPCSFLSYRKHHYSSQRGSKHSGKSTSACLMAISQKLSVTALTTSWEWTCQHLSYMIPRCI